MRLLLLEDEPYWREAIEKILATGTNYDIVGMCGTLAEALSTIRQTDFDVLVSDLGLPDGSGIEAIRAARRIRPAAAVLVATVFSDEDNVVSAICAGAGGYILKDSAPADWIAAIEALRQGGSPLSPKIARHILRLLQQPARSRRHTGALDSVNPASSPIEAHDIALTPRELEVLQLGAKGFSLVEVAQLMHVAPATTRSHAKSIYSKLEVHSRAEAVFEASRLGLI